MTDGGRESPLRSPVSGGEFLLQLLQKPNQSTLPIPQPISSTNPVNSLPSLPIDLHHPHHQSHNPGVASLNPSFPFPPWSSNGHDPHTSWPNSTSTPFPPNFIPPRFSNNPNYITLPNFSPSGINGLDYHQGSHFPGNRPIFSTENLQGSGFSRHQQQSQQQENVLMFGSLKCELGNREGSSNRSSSDPSNRLEAQFGSWKEHEKALESKSYSNSEFLSQNSVNPGQFLQFGLHSNSIDLSKGNQEPREQGREGTTPGRQQHSVYQRFTPPELRRTPPGFQQNPRGLGQEGPVRGVRDLQYNVGRQEGNFDEPKQSTYSGERIKRQPPGHRAIGGDMSSRLRLSGQLDHPGPLTRNNLHSIPGSDFEETLANFPNDIAEKGSLSGFTRKEESNRNEANAANGRVGHQEQDSLAEQLMGSLILRNRVGNANGVKIYQNTHDKDLRSDKFRAVQAQAPIHRMRSYKRILECRSDIDRLNAPFLVIYESLIPAEEEKSNQKQLLTLLEKLINKEWPRAQLFLYGSCANSFGVSNSDIDVCLVIKDADISKSEILLKLADILQSDDLQNVQALTRARVPIVKLKDPVTGISCDICINNDLAVVNTKLLRDYAQIDSRLRQLAFIVKHWAKSREVNETYRGTLSSYAYVLMCIHFLQQRKPAILPCLQGMEVTYAVTVDNVECAYFDKVERLSDFGTNNKESIAQLVWGFFDYWAYRHDYVNDVISVRTGSTISKRLKDWTRRIGNDRHLICIEDPFQTSHDLGRVVDKYSIKVLREEFERAANIMQYDPHPCKILFEHPVNQVIHPEL